MTTSRRNGGNTSQRGPGFFREHERNSRLFVALLTVLSLLVPAWVQSAPHVLAAPGRPASSHHAAAHTARKHLSDADAEQPTGLPITFTASGNCSVADATVTLTSAGSCAITAHQDGNDVYNPAQPVTQSFSIGPAATSVSVSPVTAQYDDGTTLSATVTPAVLSGQTLTGTVQFAIDGTAVGAAPIDGSGLATTPPITVTQSPGAHNITASFSSSNSSFKHSSGTGTLTVTQEDTTLTYNGDTSGDYNDPVTLKATLLEDGDAATPLANRPIDFTLGKQSCSGTTDGHGLSSCTITPNQDAGTSYTATAKYAGDTNFQGSKDSALFTLKKEETAIAYTGPAFIAQGRAATLSAVLTEDGTTPIAGRTLTLTLGSGSSAQRCTTSGTDSTGRASCAIAQVDQPYGKGAVAAGFAGDADYLPASDTSQSALIFGYLAAGSFVLGDTTAGSALTSQASVTWWGAQWATLNTLSGGTAPDSFKGFAASPSSMPPAAGGTWTTGPGNSPAPPRSVPPYMAVIVSSTISKAGSIISGDTTEIVIVKTDAGYAGDPGHAGTGTVVAVLPASTAQLLLVHLVKHQAQGAASSGHARSGSSLLGLRVHGSTRNVHRGTVSARPGAHHPMRHASGNPSAIHAHRMRPADVAAKQDQRILFNPLQDRTFGDAPFQVSAISVAAPRPAGSIEPIATTAVEGNFYPESTGATTFVAKPGDTAAFKGTFPTVSFNPPAKTIPHNISGVDPTTRPFTDITTDLVGNYSGALPAGGNGKQAGVGDLGSFDAVFTASFTVTKPGDVTFNILADDGFILGIDNGATRVSGSYENFPQPGKTAFKGYGVVGAYDQAGANNPGTYTETVHFPAAGTYPYELDYFERNPSSSTQQLSLVMTLATFTPTTTPLSVYVGYADGLRPAGSVFPYPWQGSDKVTFVGCCPAYDSGAVRVDNNSDNPITLDSVKVDIGNFGNNYYPVGNSFNGTIYNDGSVTHFNIWPGNLTVPAHSILILAQTAGSNFDTSDVDYNCSPPASVQPKVLVTVNGVTTTYVDMSQVLNTHGYDVACQGNESIAWTLIGGNASTINVPLPPTTSLQITPSIVSGDTVGQPQVLTVAAMDTSGKPAADVPVTLGIYGANTQQLTGTTDAGGLVNLSYVGQNAGKDTVTATAFVGGLQSVSNAVSVPWIIPVPGTGGGGGGNGGGGGTAEQAPPAITAPSPADGAIVTKPTPISATFAPPQGETITSWKVTYQALDPEPPVTLASGTGTPPATLATFDPTLLPNDTYAITISATASGGGTQTATTTVAVSGNLKLGRYVTTFQDLNVPVDGFQMQVRRTYDSYDKRVGDFGYGWRVDLANFRTSSNRQLGAGGWSAYPTQCILGLCFWGFKSSTPHYVTVTFPDNHQEIFDFTPTGAPIFYWEGNAAFTARPGTGTTSKLEIDGDNGLSYGFDGNLYGGDGQPYNPTRFKLTTHDGRVLVLDVHSGLVSETDPNGNSLTVDGNGIHASSGQSMSFTRDGQSRITDIAGPGGQHLHYDYNNAGDLADSVDADGNTTTYAYNGDHLLTSTTGPGGTKPLQQEVYDPATGRLTEVIDGDGNVTKISNDVSTQQQVLTDPSGKLTTVYTFDDLGDVLGVDRIANGKTLTTIATYDAAGRPLSRTDAMGRTWAGQYDAKGDLLNLTTPAGHTTAVTYNSNGAPLSWTDPRNTSAGYAYDSQGNLTSVTDPLGNKTTFVYDANGNMIKKTDPLGSVWSYTYDVQGHQISVTDPLGRTTHMTYDSAGNLLTSTDPAGNSTGYQYDSNGNMIGKTDPLGRVTKYTYTPTGRLASKTDPAGGVTTYTYDDAGQLISTTDPQGHVTTRTYDVDGRLATVTDPAGGTTMYVYDAFGRLVKTTDPVGRVTAYSYDDAGEVTARTMPNGGIYTTTYDSEGHAVSQTDPLGNTTTSTYDEDGNLLGQVDPLGRKTSYGYDAAGHLVKSTDPLGNSTITTYAADGRPLSVTNPLGQATTSAYNAAGQLISTTDATGRGTTYSYDAAGNRITATDGAGNTTKSQYDAAGELTASILPSGSTTKFSYDALGHQVSSTDALGDTTKYTYDSAGNRTSVTDPLGHTTTYSYDAAGRNTAITDALGGATHITYDAAGQKLSMTNPRGDVTAFTYDSLGDVASETDPGNRTTSYTYDLDGQQVSRTDPRGITTKNAYDAAGQVTGVTFPGGSISYAYDAAGRRTGMVDSTGTTTTSYDAAGNVTGVASPEGTIGYGYDAAGRRTSMALPGGRMLQYGYDAAGRESQITDWTGSATAFGYTIDSLQSTLTYPNGVKAASTYDAADRLTSVTDTAGGTTLASFGYTLDAAGNRVAMTTGAGTENYTLDALDRLTKVTYANGDVSSYTYDAAGNRTSETTNGVTKNYTYDAAGDLTQAGSTTYTYDASGHRTGDGADSYTWDWAGRLTGATVGGKASTNTYDGDGMRVKTVTGGVTATELRDSQAALPQLVDDGTNGYVQDPAATGDSLLAQLPHSGSAAYPIADALGSIRAMTGTSASITGTTEYGVFGGVRNTSGATTVFGFTGQQTDPTGLSYLQARYYDPAAGQFLSPDTVQPNAFGTQGYNRFAYVADNPTLGTDPSGHADTVEMAVLLRTLTPYVVAGAALAVAASWALRNLLACLNSGACAIPGSGPAAQNPPSDGGASPDTTIPPGLVQAIQQAATIAITAAIAQAVAKACTQYNVDCTGSTPIFVTGGDVMQATQHDIAAIAAKPSRVFLHRHYPAWPRDWLKNHPPECPSPRPAGQQCDEYPFASSEEGGEANNPSLKLISGIDNMDQGRALNAFYTACSVNDTNPYDVIPVPVSIVPSFGICKR